MQKVIAKFYMPVKTGPAISRTSIEMTCGGCPSQWDAETTDGEYAFIRVRHGYFRVEVAGKIVFDGYPSGIDGVMDTNEMIEYVNTNSKTVYIL